MPYMAHLPRSGGHPICQLRADQSLWSDGHQPGRIRLLHGTTFYHMTNILDDVGGSISGTVLRRLGGPITAALSAEGRFNDFTVTSNASPTPRWIARA